MSVVNPYHGSCDPGEICCRTGSRTLIPNHGYEALLIGLKLLDPGSKLKAYTKCCTKLL